MKSKSSRPTKPRNSPKDSDAPPPDPKDDLDASVGFCGGTSVAGSMHRLSEGISAQKNL